MIPADFQPLSELTFFCGMLAEGSSTPVISRIFPRIIELDIRGVTQDSLLVLGPPPSSCRMVSLRTPCFGILDLDYSVFLQACYQLRIPFLWISGARSLLPSIHEFVHATVGQFRICVCHEIMLRLECDADDVVREVWISGVFHALLQELPCFSHMERLSELVLPLELLLDMRRMQSRAITPFPWLRSLTVALPCSSTIPSLADLLARDGLPLRMPRLNALTLDAVSCDYGMDDDPNDETSFLNVPSWVTAEFPRTLPALVDTVQPRLATVTVVLASEFDAAHFAVKQDLSALRSLAETLRICDQDYRYAQDFVDG